MTARRNNVPPPVRVQPQLRPSRGSSTRPININLILAFITGFLMNHILVMFVYTNSRDDTASLQQSADGDVTSTLKQHVNTVNNTNCPPPKNYHRGIFPLMKDFQCGHENMATPRALLSAASEGNQRIVIDVGLFSGDETFDALQAGYVVFGFELNAGSIPEIKKNARERNVLDRVHFVEFVRDTATGLPIPKEVPLPPRDGRGYAYIYNAGLSDESGSVERSRMHNAVASVGGSGSTWTPGRVPIVRLDQCLPDWIERVFFLKIDTQGYEWKVLNGAEKYLQRNQIQYVQYEFSPKLMQTARSGDPMTLLNYMIAMGAICFDMLQDSGDGMHHIMGRPSMPLETYYSSLMSGKNSTHNSARNGMNYRNDPIGPWDDILCWFVGATD